MVTVYYIKYDYTYIDTHDGSNANAPWVISDCCAATYQKRECSVLSLTGPNRTRLRWQRSVATQRFNNQHMALQYYRNFHVHVNATSCKPNMNIVISIFHKLTSFIIFRTKTLWAWPTDINIIFYKLVRYFAELKGQCVVLGVRKGVDSFIDGGGGGVPWCILTSRSLSKHKHI